MSRLGDDPADAPRVEKPRQDTWDATQLLTMLAACLVYALHPKRYGEAEAALRGERLPQVSLLITSLEFAWVC